VGDRAREPGARRRGADLAGRQRDP
jgi:hypothetical protein